MQRISSFVDQDSGMRGSDHSKKNAVGETTGNRHNELSLDSDTLDSGGEIVQKVWSIGIIICWNADV